MIDTANTNEIARVREISKFVFPYYDLETSITVASELLNKAGGKASLIQLASYLGHKDEFSGAFRSKLWGAQLFGLVTISGNNIAITRLGEQLAADTKGVQRDTRLAEAFLNVPLFREVYRKYENSIMPSTREGLKRALQDTFGVSTKLITLALKSLERSSEQAGFKRGGSNRLIHPVPQGLVEKGESTEQEPVKAIPGMPEPESKITCPPQIIQPNIHPAISGFLQELPTKDKKWTGAERKRWLDAFTAMVTALYPAENE